MATVHQVLSSIQAQVTTAAAGIVSPAIAIGIDFPPIKSLMSMVQTNGAVVAVYDRKLTRNSTRWNPIPLSQTLVPATVVATVVPIDGTHSSIVLSGVLTTGDAVMVALRSDLAGHPDPYSPVSPSWGIVAAASATDTLSTLSTALITAINADATLSTWVTATSLSSTITLTAKAPHTFTNLAVGVSVGNGGSRVLEIGRRASQVQIITWANTIENRDLVAEAISTMASQMEVCLGNFPAGLTFADGSTGRVRVMNDYNLDDATMSDTYRRDIQLLVDYPVTTTDALFTVLAQIMQFSGGYYNAP